MTTRKSGYVSQVTFLPANIKTKLISMTGKGKSGSCMHTQQGISSLRTKILFCILAVHTLLRFAPPCDGKTPDAGFSLPEDMVEVRFNYRTYNELIVLAVTINDSIKANLILDTGCRNVLLFRKRFERLLGTLPNYDVRFSGLGNQPPLKGKLALNNKISIHTIVGKKIPIVILREKNLFTGSSKIDGIIGYDIFLRFEVEINSGRKQITFRSPEQAEIQGGYTKIPLTVEDTRPLVHSKIFFSGSDGASLDIMLDTGSALGLLIRSRDDVLFTDGQQHVLGKGLNGNVRGTVKWARRIVLETLEISIPEVRIYRSHWQTHGSVGMAVIKDYTLVLNYCKGYVGFKKSKVQKQFT